MSGAQFNLKDDWHAVGSSAAADRDATWRNNVSKVLNRAYVVSGGTCEVTDNGLQIEIDTDADSPYQFEVVKDTDTAVKVRGGWWAYYNGELRTQVDLDVVFGGATISDYTDLTDAITVTATGVIYLELVTDAESTTPEPTLTAKFATDAAWAALVDEDEIFRKLIASVDMPSAVIAEVRQEWKGGDILAVMSQDPDAPWPTDAPYHFEVVADTDATVKVRGGWWAYYDAKVRTQVDLAVAGPLFDDLTGAIAVTDTGVIYLELDTDVDTLTAKFATDAAWAALVDADDIYRKLIADIVVVAAAISTIKQDWRGGNILSWLDGAVAHADTTGRTANDHHNELHTIESHSDTTATGPELDELTDGSETTLHSHAGSGGGGDLDDLDDVTITSPALYMVVSKTAAAEGQPASWIDDYPRWNSASP